MGEPARLPDFETLAMLIAQGAGEEIVDGEPEDRFLGRLETDKRVPVHARAADLLTRRRPSPTELHRNLMRLFPSAAHTRIVTTNFDLLFEQVVGNAAAGSKPDVYAAPALPLGREFQGVVHVHGRVDRPETMVLTDADFGRAYLTDGWARRFLVDMFRSFTVLFVGYSHGDVVMNYLARALPAGDSQRFALTDEAEDMRWSRLGVTPIRFPESDYRALSVSIGQLAEYRSRGILEWQHLIREIAKSEPPTGDYEVETLAEAFTDPARTRFFTASAMDPAWIHWLDRKKHLINLFQGRVQLTAPESDLANWLAKAFAWDHPEEVWHLIGRHGMQVHPEFWKQLTYAVGLPAANITDRETLSRWVSVLLATAPSPAPDFALQHLADRCVEREAVASLIAIFEHVTTLQLRFSRWLYGDSESGPVPDVRAELDAASDDYRHTATHIWQKGVRPNLGQFADGLLAYVVANLKAQYRTLSTWGAAAGDWDPLSMSRFSIKPTDKAVPPQLREIGDVLIDAAGECLEWLASNKPLEATQWCDRLAAEPAPILRRLAIHGVLSRNLDPDATIDWMLRHSSQYDESARHERIRASKIAYPGAIENRRRAVIKDILDYQCPGPQDKDRDEHTLSHQFSWLEWLLEAAPECRLLNEALDSLRQRHPGFRYREFPDEGHRTWLDDKIPFSPWTTEALLSHSAHDWTDKLLEYEPSDPLQPDRRRLLDVVTRASAQDIDWGLELAEDLLRKDKYKTDLWSGILRSWSTTKLGVSQYLRALQILGSKPLYGSHLRPIADALQAIVRHHELSDDHDLIERANAVAADLWESVDGRDIPEECEDWLIKAWNHPAGVLTQFWIDSLVFLYKRRETQAADIERYRTRFSEILCDGTAVGRLGLCVLARHLAMLLDVDEAWTKNNLLPLVYDYPHRPNRTDHTAVWDGLLSGTIDTPVAQILRVPLLDATEWMTKEPAGSTRRKSFVECYTFVLTFFAGDPVDTWIPMLLKWVSAEERMTFVRSVRERLENMNEAQQADLWKRWLMQHWKNRVQGIPDGLIPREAWHMLRWLPLLQKVFPEAVDVAIGVAPNIVDPEPERNIVVTLSQSDLPTNCPESVAKLLIYVGKCERYKNWYGGKELVDGLLKHDLGDDLKTGLKELVAQRGLQ